MATQLTERERLLALHARQIAAWRERDLATLSEVFHPDCLIFHGRSPVLKGWEAYRERLEERLGALESFEIRAFDEVLRVDERLEDRIAWIAARYEIEGVKGGAPHQETGRWTGIYEKADDRWRIVHFHISPDP